MENFQQNKPRKPLGHSMCRFNWSLQDQTQGKRISNYGASTMIDPARFEMHKSKNKTAAEVADICKQRFTQYPYHNESTLIMFTMAEFAKMVKTIMASNSNNHD
jgi:hypothetical protein